MDAPVKLKGICASSLSPLMLLCDEEAEAVMALGVEAERIIFAHPVKSPAQIRWAASAGVNLTTFDTLSELEKLFKFHPSTGDPSAIPGVMTYLWYSV